MSVGRVGETACVRLRCSADGLVESSVDRRWLADCGDGMRGREVEERMERRPIVLERLVGFPRD